MRKGYNVMNVRVCANCDNGFPVEENIDRPDHNIKCRLWGFRKMNDSCSKWKQLYNRPFSTIKTDKDTRIVLM